jgi:hypothetical protein
MNGDEVIIALKNISKYSDQFVNRIAKQILNEKMKKN